MPTASSTRDDVRQRIVAAAADLLHSGGAAAVTTRSVAQDAGVQAPTIYRLFGDKDGLLDAVAEHVMSEYAAAKAAVVAEAEAGGIDPLVDLREGWHAQIEFGLANPDVFRLLSEPDRVATSPAAARGRAVLEARVRRVAETGRLRVGEERALGMLSAAGVGAIQTLLASPPDRRDLGVAEEIYGAVLDRILTDAPARGEAGAAAPLHALRALAPTLPGLSAGERDLLAEWIERALAAGASSPSSSPASASSDVR